MGAIYDGGDGRATRFDFDSLKDPTSDEEGSAGVI